MDSDSRLYLSNQTEKLYQGLKGHLFNNSHPLTKRIVVVPNAAMKSWLAIQLARDQEIGISTGIEINFVEPAVHQLFSLLSEPEAIKQDIYEPTELELSLAIEDSICKTVCEFLAPSSPFPKEWLPLMEYLGISSDKEKPFSKKSLHRIQTLAPLLAKLFREYGVYGGGMIAEWKGKEWDHWQALLWKQMEQIFADWHYPVKKLGSFQLNQSLDPQDIQVHLFGLSFLAPLYHSFLKNISSHLPVHYYLLSPCQKFWGDILSDKEGIRLVNYWNKKNAAQKSVETLEDLLSDKNPLLSNFGRLGREMTIQAESMDPYSTEIYALPEALLDIPEYSDLISEEIILEKTNENLTLLEAVQSDIALLRSPEDQKKITFDGYDGTIQIHAAPKKMREVEAIYDALLAVIDKHADEACPIVAGDIFVMAPDITEYAPFIRSVFESSESLLEIQLMDLQDPFRHLLVQGFLHLLSLSGGRWQASALMQLFSYPAFRSRYKLTEDDIYQIEKWVKKAGIRWGKDNCHREELFNRQYERNDATGESSIGTWEYGLGRLLEGLALSGTDELQQEERFCPVDGIERSQGDLLGILIHLIRSLQCDLKPLTDGRALSLGDWSAYLACLLEAYFLPCREEDADGHRILLEAIEAIAKASARISQSAYSFETILLNFKSLLKGEQAAYKESNLNAVRFSSFLPMRAVPAKVIVLMGMNDGAFPRIDRKNTLNLLLEKMSFGIGSDYYPQQADTDRYLFLESILSARKYFILSYVNQEAGEANTLPPSLLVKELIHYLDHSYAIGKEQKLDTPSTFCLRTHPLNAFHSSYFSENSAFKSYSCSNYLAALSCYNLEKKPKRPFIQEFLPYNANGEAVAYQKTISLKELLAFSKNPLKFFLNQDLGIYIDNKSDRMIKNEEDPFLSDLDAAILIRQGVFGSKTSALSKGEKSGKIPQGPFKKAIVDKISREIHQCKKNLHSLEIDLNPIFFMEFMDKHLQLEFLEGGWKMPAISVYATGIGHVKIEGRLEHVSEKGLVQLSKDEPKKMFEIWPSCLVLRWLIQKYQLPIIPQVVFARGMKARIQKIEQNENTKTPEESLSDYLTYYLKRKSGPSPLMPDWMPAILSGSSEEVYQPLKKMPKDDFRPKFDQYLNWLERNSSHAELESTAGHWQTLGNNLFSGLFAESKSKKQADESREESHGLV